MPLLCLQVKDVAYKTLEVASALRYREGIEKVAYYCTSSLILKYFDTIYNIDDTVLKY